MLHIWLPTQYSQLYVWLDKQQIWQAHENWQSISEHFSDRMACLYFPSWHILQLESTLPSAKLKQLGESGKQYLFEELSLTSVEQLRIREYADKGHHYLYACATNDISQWHNSASLVGIEIQYMLPDFLLLPVADGAGGKDASAVKVSLYSDKHTSLLRQSQACGTAVSFLPLITESLQLVDEVIVVPNIEDGQPDAQLLNVLQNLETLHSLSAKTLRPVEQPHRQPLNFMLKTRQRFLSPYLKTTLVVAMLALVLQMFADGLSIYQYNKVAKATETVINKQYKAWFPDDRLNPKTSLKAQLEPMLTSAGTAENTALALLSRVSPLIKQSNLTASSLLAKEATLKLTLVADNRSELDRFMQKLQQQGMVAELGQVRNTTASNTQTNKANSQQVTGDVLIKQ